MIDDSKVKRTSAFMTSAGFAEKQYSPLTHGEFGMTAAQRDKLNNLNASERVFAAAKELAADHGLLLRRCAERHFQLRRGRKWIIDIYPSTQRVSINDVYGRAPAIENFVPQIWNVYTLVSLVIERWQVETHERQANRSRHRERRVIGYSAASGFNRRLYRR